MKRMASIVILFAFASLISFQSPAFGADKTYKQLSDEFLTNAGAKPVGCGMGSDFGLFAYIGCGKVAVSFNEFKKRVHAEMKRRKWTIFRDWKKGDLNGMPTVGTSATVTPYLDLIIEVRWPSNLPVSVFMMWLKTREMTPEERRQLEQLEKKK